MEKSSNFEFNLPSSENDDLADINDISDNFRIIDNEVPKKQELQEVKIIAETAEQIAKGRATGYVFDTVNDLDLWLENPNNIDLLIQGDNFYIRAIDVPDYWWDGTQKQQLETQKVDLADYVKNTDYARPGKAGIVLVDEKLGIDTDEHNRLQILKALTEHIENRGSLNEEEEVYHTNNNPIVPVSIDLAVKEALSNCKLGTGDIMGEPWTDEEKAAARALLNIVGNADYATTEKHGIIKIFEPYGLRMHPSGNGVPFILKAETSEIDNKNGNYKPIVPAILDYAVKSALSNCQLGSKGHGDPWTNEEKAAARDLLGITAAIEKALTDRGL